LGLIAVIAEPPLQDFNWREARIIYRESIKHL